MERHYLKTDEIKVNILKYLSKDEKWHSFYDLQKGLNINYSSIKLHLSFMEKFDLVDLSIMKPEESSTGKGSYRVRITDRGKLYLGKFL